jgi:hypothetical protein
VRGLKVTFALELMIMRFFDRLNSLEENLRFVSIDKHMMDNFKMAARHEFAIIQYVLMLAIEILGFGIINFLFFPKLQKIRLMQNGHRDYCFIFCALCTEKTER